MSHKVSDKETEETQKAKQLVDKDVPNADKNAEYKGSHQQEPRPFRPNENVDNQKSEKSRSVPSHNTSIKETPIQGAQLAKEKKSHKDDINKKADEADPKGSE